MFPNGCYSGNTPQWKFQLILKYSLHVYLDSLGKCQDFVRAVLHCVQPFVTPWTVACQAPLSLGFYRQAYWSGLPFPSPGDLPHLGIEFKSLTSSALAGRFFITSATWVALGRVNL